MQGGIRMFAFDLDDPLPPGAQHSLDQAERARAMRFATSGLRHRFIAGRAGLRRLLADALGDEPGQLRIEEGTDGKPRLHDGRIAFNLSHAGRHAILAIGPADLELGIDIEDIDALADVDALAALCLSPVERSGFAGFADETARRASFLRLWVRKEACLKAIGQGLRIEPATFTVGFHPPGADWPARIHDEFLRVSDIDLGPAGFEAGLNAAIAVIGGAAMPLLAPVVRLSPAPAGRE